MKHTKNERKSHRTNKFYNQVSRMRKLEARDDDSLAFIHKYFVTGSFPHSEPSTNFYSIVNGHNAIWVKGGTDVDTRTGEEIKIGVPYGTLPRLITAWITTEAKRTKSREIQLGLSLTHFLNQLGLQVTGGQNGTIGRVKEQLYRLAHCEIGYKRVGEDSQKIKKEFRHYKLIEGGEFWDWKVPNQLEIFGSYIQLNSSFYDILMERPVPVDMRALKALKSSALALDLYMWLTYRASSGKGTVLNWEQVMNQLGAEYTETKNFARKVKKYLKIIKTFWPELNYRTPYGRFQLLECSPHIKKKSSE